MTATRIEFLIIVIAIVAILARRLRLPYTVGLLLAGVGLGLLPGNDELRMTRDLIFTFLLPPLVFEAAINLPWKALKTDLLLVLTYATIGLALSASVVAAGMYQFAGWPLGISIVFAVLISATDPVSVIAAFKDSRKHGRIRLLVESESLLNDGTAAVAFTLAVAFALGSHVSAQQAIWQFFVSAGGGILAGAIVAFVGLVAVGRTDDHLVEIAVTVAIAYGSFLLAEELHLSGVLATVTAGLIAANFGSAGSLTDKGRESVDSFWEFAAFAANSVVFLLIGLRLSRTSLLPVLAPTVLAIVLVLVGRAITVYGVATVFSKSRWKVTFAGQHLLFWGGLRGALALALVLGVPEEAGVPAALPAATLGVVVFSVVVQGLTIRPLIDRATQALPEVNAP